MSREEARRTGRPARLLTRQEIDRRIGRVMAAVRDGAPRADDGSPAGPRWIRAADLAERVRPFLGWN